VSAGDHERSKGYNVKARTTLACVFVACCLGLGCSRRGYSPWTEPEFVQWQLEHPESTDPLTDYIRDNSQPPKPRQRMWQAKQKIKWPRTVEE